MPDPYTSPYPSAAPPPPSVQPGLPQDQQVFAMPDKFRGPAGDLKRGGGGRRWFLWIIIGVFIVAAVGVGSYFLFSQLNNANANENLNTVANTGNANANVNRNANVNQSTNSGFLTNTANANENANLNANVNATTNTNTTNANTNTAPAPRSPLPSSLDTDGDGLTDLEESQIYTTDRQKPDTDGDSFIDGKQITGSGIVGEVYQGYNPNGAGRLSASTLVKSYENATQSYAVLVPTPWTVTESDQLRKTVILSPATSTGEFVQISIQDNPNQATPKEWYLSLNPGVSPSDVSEVTVNGLLGAVSLDGQTIYLGKGSVIYALTYDSGSLSQLNYRTTFEMMYQSFRLLSA